MYFIYKHCINRKLALYCYTVPAIIPIEQTLESNIDDGEFIFFQFQLPSNGMTIQLEQLSGSVTLYGSFDAQNPNSAFHSFRIESSGDVFVAHEYDVQSPALDQRLSKRLVKSITERGSSRELSNTTLYISIEGLQDFSSFTLDTTFGDTCKLDLSSSFVSLVAFVTLYSWSSKTSQDCRTTSFNMQCHCCCSILRLSQLF